MQSDIDEREDYDFVRFLRKRRRRRLAVLADGLPAVKAACPQAMLEGVPDQPA
jgi:hypothetical protein